MESKDTKNSQVSKAPAVMSNKLGKKYSNSNHERNWKSDYVRSTNPYMDYEAKEEGLTGSCLSELSHPRLPEKRKNGKLLMLPQVV